MLMHWLAFAVVGAIVAKCNSLLTALAAGGSAQVDEEEIPMFFKKVEQLTDYFQRMEEDNLFMMMQYALLPAQPVRYSAVTHDAVYPRRPPLLLRSFVHPTLHAVHMLNIDRLLPNWPDLPRLAASATGARSPR